MASNMSDRTVTGWAARDASGVLSPYTFTLRKTGPNDVLIRVLFCGLCHTDLHKTRNEQGTSKYPMVPGQEAVGKVTELGPAVTRFNIGDTVGVGVIVGNCGRCGPCLTNAEQYCKERIWTYNDVYIDGKPTQGGLASAMVVDQKFVVKIPNGLAAEQASPLLGAGVTVYSPLKHLGLLRSGLRGGILGLGGVGHVGVKMGKAMGHHVTVISSSERKRVEAIDHLEADEYLVSSDENGMALAANTLDYIIDTVPGFHPLDKYLSLLKVDGKIVLLGIVDQPLQFFAPTVMLGRKAITASLIGSMQEMQELLYLWAEKGLTSMIEIVKMDQVNEALERLERNDVRYRFVADVASSNLNP